MGTARTLGKGVQREVFCYCSSKTVQQKIM